jgi:hypothetical protein
VGSFWLNGRQQPCKPFHCFGSEHPVHRSSPSLEAAQGEKIADTRARDLLSLLVRANTAADARERLSDQDVLARMCLLPVTRMLC